MAIAFIKQPANETGLQLEVQSVEYRWQFAIPKMNVVSVKHVSVFRMLL
jgi:heme/copper-type cytochrome/quinol oxidase subunit 2